VIGEDRSLTVANLEPAVGSLEKAFHRLRKELAGPRQRSLDAADS
jgi:hypothetical protein